MLFKYSVGKMDALVWPHVFKSCIFKVTPKREKWCLFLSPAWQKKKKKIAKEQDFCHSSPVKECLGTCWIATATLHPLSCTAPQDHFHLCKGNEAEKSVQSHVPTDTWWDFPILIACCKCLHPSDGTNTTHKKGIPIAASLKNKKAALPTKDFSPN